MLINLDFVNLIANKIMFVLRYLFHCELVNYIPYQKGACGILFGSVGICLLAVKISWKQFCFLVSMHVIFSSYAFKLINFGSLLNLLSLFFF